MACLRRMLTKSMQGVTFFLIAIILRIIVNLDMLSQASMLSTKTEDGAKRGSPSGQPKNTRRGSVVNRRTGLKAALNVSMRAPKPQSLPSYLVKVLLSLVQARLEAQVGSFTRNNHAISCLSD